MQGHQHIPVRERNIIFIGFMGVGKTTIGQLVAQKLYRDFIDVDREIESHYHMSVAHIFQTYGETEFRKMEKQYITNLCRHSRLKVISLGGGAFLQEEIRSICLATSIVLLLDLTWESWKERLQLIVESRPVLQHKSLEEIEQLFISRQSAYSQHHSAIPTDHLDSAEAADYIIQTLKLGWDMYAPTNPLF